MKIYAINGSPRKKWNTATVLEHALAGAARCGAETEIIHLYSLSYKGCVSCFECKRLGGPSYGRCAVRDDLAEVFPKILQADALIFGSPVYFGDVTGMMRSFLERLLFPNFVYDQNRTSLAPKKMPTAFVYTMNVDHENMEKMGYPENLGRMEGFIARVFGYPTAKQYVCDTLQFADYSKYKQEVFSAAAKEKQRAEQFPIDLENAERLGASLVQR